MTVNLIIAYKSTSSYRLKIRSSTINLIVQLFLEDFYSVKPDLWSLKNNSFYLMVANSPVHTVFSPYHG